MTAKIAFAAAGLLALGACTNSTPAENASRNISQSADNMAADFGNATRNASAEVANRTAEMSGAVDNAAAVAENRAARVREAAGNSVRDIGNAAEGR